MIRGSLMLAALTVLALLQSPANAFVSSSTALFKTNCDPRSQRGLNHGRSSRSRSSLTTMMAEKNRRVRRYSDKQKKRAASKGPRQPASLSDAKWLQVLEETPEMPAGSVKVVSGKYKDNDKFFTLASHGGNYFAVSEACGRCKFPMINGKVKLLLGEGKAEEVKQGVEQDPEAEIGIGCPLCGAMFDMRTGEIAGEQPQGLAQMFVSKVVSQTPVESITVYPTQELSSGAIVVRVD